MFDPEVLLANKKAELPNEYDRERWVLDLEEMSLQSFFTTTVEEHIKQHDELVHRFRGMLLAPPFLVYR